MTGTKARWGAIFAGAFVCLALVIVFSVLGAAIGLSAIPVERGETPAQGFAIGAGLYELLTTIVSFLIGGYTAGRLADVGERLSSSLHGVATWALVAVGATFLISGTALSSLGGLLSKAGLAIGAGSGASAFFAEVERQHPRLVSDIHLKEGIIITEVRSGAQEGGGRGPAANEVVKKGKQLGRQISSELNKPRVQADIRDTAGDVRKATAGASWLLFGGLVVSGLAAFWGGAIGGRAHARSA